MFFYIQTNKDWEYQEKFKYGVTNNPYQRENKIDQHSYRSNFIHIYKYELTEQYNLLISKNKYRNIDEIIKKYYKNKFNKHLPILLLLKNHLVNHNGGTEFIFKSGLELLKNIIIEHFPKIGIIINEIDHSEIQKINNYHYDLSYNDYSSSDDEIYFNDNYKIIPRNYQINIINQVMEKLKNNIYISLATGAGKSYITYSIINKLYQKGLIKTIIILTPRINICEQNINDKYLKILDNALSFKIYNKNNLNYINNNDNNIICCCINSYNKIYSSIINNNLSNILIWFDESHYGIDNWISQYLNKQKQYLLTDNSKIKYRIFTSASPDKDFITYNNKIFGELINPYKISDLIEDKWLCKLEVYIYKEKLKDFETKIDSETFVKFIINQFNNKQKTAGLCFCNNCDNAIELFKYHYEIYNENKNDNIMPFLLLNNNKIKELSKFKFPNELLNINNFNASDNIDKPNLNKRIAYIVQMYSMGYDNRDIDFMVFKDPKLSYKDIIQSIGRGLRSDCKGLNGKNEEKETAIILPVYINLEDDADKFDKIKEVLKFLIMDIELIMKNINIISNSKKNKTEKEIKEYEEEFNKFKKDIETIIYDIRKGLIKWNLLKITKQLKYNNIHNFKDYLIYINENKDLNLPENLFKYFPDFDFTETYYNNDCPYYSKNECIEAINKYKKLLLYNSEKINKNNNLELLEFLNLKDPKIPKECLWNYYGGIIDDYIIFNKNI